MSNTLVGLVPSPIRRWYETEHGRKMSRYAMVSVVAVPVGTLGIIIGNVILGLSPGWGAVFGNSLGAIPSYYLNRTWVWGKGGRSHLVKEILPFWIISLIGVAFGGWFGSLGGAYAKNHHITGNVRDVVLLPGANLLAFAILWAAKYVVFNKVLFAVAHHDGAVHTHTEHTEAGLAGAAGAPEL